MPPGRALGTIGPSKPFKAPSLFLSTVVLILAPAARLLQGWSVEQARGKTPWMISSHQGRLYARGMEAPGKTYQLRYGRSKHGDDDVSSSPS